MMTTPMATKSYKESQADAAGGLGRQWVVGAAEELLYGRRKYGLKRRIMGLLELRKRFRLLIIIIHNPWQTAKRNAVRRIQQPVAIRIFRDNRSICYHGSEQWTDRTDSPGL